MQIVQIQHYQMLKLQKGEKYIFISMQTNILKSKVGAVQILGRGTKHFKNNVFQCKLAMNWGISSSTGHNLAWHIQATYTAIQKTPFQGGLVNFRNMTLNDTLHA